ncbi:MAG TPA: HPF/RaiA family ribosome-associated protein [Kofleriaceae bacterium]|jgi:ribosome-associated translation inhibitor RaiA|nr:HPF/RaiA family ribosome-associated protein [Kofleriaceae bacterium]
MLAVLERAIVRPRAPASTPGASMQIATTFRDMTPSPALQAAVERWAERLGQLSRRIVACHVAIEKPHRHHLHGSGFEIHVVLTVPGAQLAASGAQLDPYVAVADAFRAARRQLVHHVDSQRHFVKARPAVHAVFAAAK